VLAFGAAASWTASAWGQKEPDNIWHVDDNAPPPGGDGMSFPTAFNNLQDAIDEAHDSQGSDLILVAQGIYFPSAGPNPPRGLTFLIDFDMVRIEGGYRGCPTGNCGENPPGTEPEDRDVDLFETILSGHITWPENSACGPGAGPCDQAHPTPGCDDEDCCEFVCDDVFGIPFCCECEWAEDCVALAQSCPGNMYHVVTFVGVDRTARLDGVTVMAGSANGGSIDNQGGAMRIGGAAAGIAASPTIAQCVLEGNIAVSGGAVYVENSSSSPQFVNCSFLTNTASGSGAAIYVASGSVQVHNGVFFQNTASSQGGGVFVARSAGAQLEDCTLSANTALSGGGAFGPVDVENSIVWGNAPSQLVGAADVDYSDVQGGHTGEGNLDVDPQFLDPAGGDLRLALGSPCNDSGSNELVPPDAANIDGDDTTLEPLPLDVARNRRFGLAAANAPHPCDHGDVDMGAYENADCQPNGTRDEDEPDSNGDGIPDDCQDCQPNMLFDPDEIAGCPPADPDCQDCNENLVPDECDIAGGCSTDKNGDSVPDECECGTEALDIVFILDTSGSISSEIDDAWIMAANVVDALAGPTSCLDVQAKLLGITVTPPCPECPPFPGVVSNVLAAFGPDVPGDNGSCGPLLDSEESWGPAAAIVSVENAWRSFVRRVIVTISDEGSCRGSNPCEAAAGPDRDSIDNAGIVADANTVFVYTIVGEGPQEAECVRQLAQDLALQTEAQSFDVALHGGYPGVEILLRDALLALVGSCKDPCACPADIRAAGGGCGTHDGVVGWPDLSCLLQNWNSSQPCPDCCNNPNCLADLTGDCFVNVDDLLELLPQWGPCPCGMLAGGGPGPDALPLEEALAAIGFDSLVQFEIWLHGAQDHEALVVAELLLEALGGGQEE
jgi:hypothetical protein